jgi:hypothetical protein
MTPAKATEKGKRASLQLLEPPETSPRIQNDLTGVVAMKTRLLVSWLIALGLIAAAEAQTAIREHARGHIAIAHK